MASPALVPDPACLHLLRLEAKGQTMLMEVVTRATEACCPLCQRPAERMHSRYQRWVADLRFCQPGGPGVPPCAPVFL